MMKFILENREPRSFSFCEKGVIPEECHCWSVKQEVTCFDQHAVRSLVKLLYQNVLSLARYICNN